MHLACSLKILNAVYNCSMFIMFIAVSYLEVIRHDCMFLLFMFYNLQARYYLYSIYGHAGREIKSFYEYDIATHY